MCIETCANCGKSLGMAVQETMLGVPKLCILCETARQAKHMLVLLPEGNDSPERDRLSDWENGFLDSVREQFLRKGTVSEKQFVVLEKIYIKLR